MERDGGTLKALGSVVAERRKKLGISQEELAHRARLSRAYIGDIERGARNLALKNIFKLALALETSPSKLVRDVEKLLLKVRAR